VGARDKFKSIIDLEKNILLTEEGRDTRNVNRRKGDMGAGKEIPPCQSKRSA